MSICIKQGVGKGPQPAGHQPEAMLGVRNKGTSEGRASQGQAISDRVGRDGLLPTGNEERGVLSNT